MQSYERVDLFLPFLVVLILIIFAYYLYVFMFYQLPNGKTIIISIEDYLDMSDADIDFLVKANVGSQLNNPWANSAIKEEKKKKESTDLDYEYEDDDESFDNTDISIEDTETSIEELPDNLLNI